MTKKQIREIFRKIVFQRDKHTCVMCGFKPKSTDVVEQVLNAHHINDRHTFSDGGYIISNGITLCAGNNKNNCHWKAEQFHATGTSYPGYSPEDLLRKI